MNLPDISSFYWWPGVVANLVLLGVGLYATCGELMFRARWKWGNAHKLARSVRLGWNTGMPPEGKPFIARSHAFHAADGVPIFVRRRYRCYALDGSFVAPATSIIGWLAVLERPS